MSTVTIACRTHPGVTLWQGELEDHGLIAALLFQQHAGGLHAGMHEYELLIDGLTMPAAARAPSVPATKNVTLEISLVENPTDRIRVEDCPTWLVGALTVQFHAAREGKPFKMWVDGREF